MSSYQIIDEPAPGPLARFACNPIFPFLSFLIGGLWIAWPWLAFNGIAIGSPTRSRELMWLGGSVVAVGVIIIVLSQLILAEILVGPASRYAALSIPIVKLAALYAVYVLQARTIEIYEYYGGVLRNGLLVLVAMILLRPDRLLSELPTFFQMVLT